MTDPVNYQGPTTADAVAKVEKFLSTPVSNETGGWTDVTYEQWEEVVDVFRTILDAKFERDPDGDHTIQFETCHRQRGRMETVHVPYNLDTLKEKEQALHAISMASGIIERLTRSLQFKVSDERLLQARRDKMAPVIRFCASNGHIRAHNRIVDYVERTDTSLFVGRDDDVWAPLGLTCAELKAEQHLNLGKHNLHEKMEDYLLTAAKAMGA